MFRLLLSLMVMWSATTAFCGDLFHSAAKANGINPALLRSIAEMESNVNPWALNLNREGFLPATKAQAVELVEQAQSKPWLLRVDYSEKNKRSTDQHQRLFFLSKADAEAALSDIRRGAKLLGTPSPTHWEIRKLDTRSVDVGLMQINWKFHGQNFESLEQLFEPRNNINYAAKYLASLIRRHGSVQGAVAHYHSNTEEYQSRYLALFMPIFERQQVLAQP